MGSAMFMWDRTTGGTMDYPVGRGRYDVQHMHALARQVLPTDSIGNYALTLTNVVIGSVYDIEALSTGALIASGTATGSSVNISIPVYTNGDPKNSLRIKLRKASAAPFYQPFETQATALVGAQSIFVNQLTDE